MTEQEAIKGIKNEMECVLSEHSTSYFDECLEVAYASMEKQIAKKPVKRSFIVPHEGINVCPSCKKPLVKKEHHCKCGQKLDWGNEDAE